MEYEYLQIPISKLVPNTWNYKKENRQLYQKLKVNISKGGQLQTLLVREGETNYQVIDGVTRLQIMKELGFEETICCNLGKISDVSAKLISIEVNQTRFDLNCINFIELFQEVMQKISKEDLLSTLPFTLEELTHMEKLFDFDWSQFEDEDDKQLSFL